MVGLRYSQVRIIFQFNLGVGRFEGFGSIIDNQIIDIQITDKQITDSIKLPTIKILTVLNYRQNTDRKKITKNFF